MRSRITNLYIRTCKDSGFKLDYIEAAKLVSRMLNITPFEVYQAFGHLRVMEQVALSEHPASR